MPEPQTPSCDDNTTTSTPVNDPAAHPEQLLCPICWTPFTRTRRQRYCTDARRKTAWTRRHANTPTETLLPQTIRRRDTTIYACPSCETHYHPQQWCHDCNQPCTRVGLGGLCPHCDEPVALADLLDTTETTQTREPDHTHGWGTSMINSRDSRQAPSHRLVGQGDVVLDGAGEVSLGVPARLVGFEAWYIERSCW